MYQNGPARKPDQARTRLLSRPHFRQCVVFANGIRIRDGVATPAVGVSAPHMDGVKLYNQLHTTDGLEHVPTLFLSATPPTGELEKRQIESIRKPFELEEVLQAIARLLG